MAGIKYNTGALLAAARIDRRMWALRAGYLELETVPTVPAPVLAEAWRGGSRQARLSRLLAMCAVEPMTEEQARSVGVLAGRAAHDDVVDVTVVEGAIRRGDAVVTSDLETSAASRVRPGRPFASRQSSDGGGAGLAAPLPLERIEAVDLPDRPTVEYDVYTAARAVRDITRRTRSLVVVGR